MLNEAVKKQMINGQELYQKKRWQGKPLSFKFKYLYANYPEILVGSAVLVVVCPLILAYRFWNIENSASYGLKKYRLNYTVVRDDHPNIEAIREEKEKKTSYFNYQ